MDLTEIFCIIDDFCKEFETLLNSYLISAGRLAPKRRSRLSTSEIITILILFHHSGYRNFKHFYLRHVCFSLQREFPGICSYTQFLGLQKKVVFPLFCFLHGLLGQCTGISIVDSTSLEVCHIKRFYSHRVFKGIAKKSKTTKGWFYGLKLHLIIKEGFSWSQRLVKNMKNKLMSVYDKLLLKRRWVVDSVIGQLEHGCQIEHTRHRSPIHFVINLMGGLASYSLWPRKPTLNMRKYNYKSLMHC